AKVINAVLPAHAGMIRRQGLHRADSGGAPRARGDDPPLPALTRPRAKVLPAHAGMIPLARHLLTAGSRAPRARGMIRRLGRGGVARASALGGMRDAPKQLTPTRLRDGASRVATTAEEILPSDAWVLVLVATLLDQSGVLMGRRGHKRRLDI